MKSAKQEAQRIFERFYNETLSHLSDHNTKEDARISAIICVEEISKRVDVFDREYYDSMIPIIKKLK